MKHLVILLALAVLQIQSVAVATTVKKPAQKTQATQNVSNKTTAQVYKQDDNNYLLKYNIDDLEAAPWLNNGERVYKKEASK